MSGGVRSKSVDGLRSWSASASVKTRIACLRSVATIRGLAVSFLEIVHSDGTGETGVTGLPALTGGSE